jgi:hypothetical protein
MSVSRRGLPLLAFSFSLVGVLGEPVAAVAVASRTSCWQGFWNCMDNASQLDSFWRRGAAGIDCTVDLAICAWNSLFN